MYKGLKVSLIIPCYNEEDGIKSVLDDVPEVVDEVIVVDNNCTDKTAEIAIKMGARVVSETKQGYGAAYKKGFSEANGDVITTLDADGMYPIESILYLVKILVKEELDFITVRRRPDRMRSPESWLRFTGDAVLNLFMYFLFGIKTLDSQSGMWIFRKSILGKINLVSDGMPLSEEIKIETFLNKDIRTKEITQLYHDRRIGNSKLNLFLDGFGNLFFLFKKKNMMKKSK
jgi:glycosyltransferase involved in cell wall biosynthesis